MKKLAQMLLLLFLFATVSAQQDGFIGEVKLFAGNFNPRTWMLCQGQILPINSYQALFSIIGTYYGGDGRTTFALPDLRGRMPIGVGQGPGLTNRQIGRNGGYESAALTTANMPAHNHTATLTASGQMMCDSLSSIDDSPGGNTLSRSEINIYSSNSSTIAMQDSSVLVTGTVTIGNNGGGMTHENMQPFLGMNYIICIQGTFPSRDKNITKP